MVRNGVGSSGSEGSIDALCFGYMDLQPKQSHDDLKSLHFMKQLTCQIIHVELTYPGNINVPLMYHYRAIKDLNGTLMVRALCVHCM